jgi:hypothetical protein
MANDYVRGIREIQAELLAMQARTDAATRAALLKVQRQAVVSVRSGMRGRPRWDRRGAIGNGGSVPAVNLNLNPHHVTKGGGPGSLTGHLRRAVGSVKRPKMTPKGLSGGIGVGGGKSITNLYRNHVEASHPFMKPGVAKATPKFPAVWEAAWAKATATKK